MPFTSSDLLAIAPKNSSSLSPEGGFGSALGLEPATIRISLTKVAFIRRAAKFTTPNPQFSQDHFPLRH